MINVIDESRKRPYSILNPAVPYWKVTSEGLGCKAEDALRVATGRDVIE
jgi:hypothetical protein